MCIYENVRKRNRKKKEETKIEKEKAMKGDKNAPRQGNNNNAYGM